MLAIDLDYFKQLNDSLGHDQGDAALRAAGETLNASLRDGDLAGRIGGDELVVCLRGTTARGAKAVAERFMKLFAQHQSSSGIEQHWPSMSVGVACAMEHRAQGPQHLRRMADEALYDAKRAGRGVCRVRALPGPASAAA